MVLYQRFTFHDLFFATCRSICLFSWIKLSFVFHPLRTSRTGIGSSYIAVAADLAQQMMIIVSADGTKTWLNRSKIIEEQERFYHRGKTYILKSAIGR